MKNFVWKSVLTRHFKAVKKFQENAFEEFKSKEFDELYEKLNNGYKLCTEVDSSFENTWVGKLLKNEEKDLNGIELAIFKVDLLYQFDIARIRYVIVMDEKIKDNLKIFNFLKRHSNSIWYKDEFDDKSVSMYFCYDLDSEFIKKLLENENKFFETPNFYGLKIGNIKFTISTKNARIKLIKK